MTAPLAGVSVIEIDNWMAAPSAGAILADLGAEVIKIEPLRGDPMRGMGRPPKIAEGAAKQYDYGFDVDNRGKRSVAVDLTQEAGQEIVRRLVTDADVFLCNLLRRRQERFGLDPDALLARNPRLVHATLTGYGTEGPEAWRPGYDVTAFFGRSGLYDAMREGEDGYVPMARPAQGDHTTGLALVAGILAALRQAERTGEGQAVETSLYETAVWTQATDFAVTAVDRAPVRRRRRHQMISATANRYPLRRRSLDRDQHAGALRLAALRRGDRHAAVARGRAFPGHEGALRQHGGDRRRHRRRARGEGARRVGPDLRRGGDHLGPRAEPRRGRLGSAGARHRPVPGDRARDHRPLPDRGRTHALLTR